MIRKSFVPVLAFGVVLAMGLGMTQARADDDSDFKSHFKNGKIDKDTFHGYLFYGDNCLRCHGPDGLGSSYAPNLTDALKSLTKEQFEQTVINGKKDVNTAQQLVMPAFGTNADVVANLDNIYDYLKGRSLGLIARGRPQRFDDN